ncbi:hypothetical protein ATKI12_0738 [Kitasatospora sp. Ki12]
MHAKLLPEIDGSSRGPGSGQGVPGGLLGGEDVRPEPARVAVPGNLPGARRVGGGTPWSPCASRRTPPGARPPGGPVHP